MAKKTVQPQDKFVLRLPDGFREMIQQEAETWGRSMNAEIIYRLDQAYTTWPVITLPLHLRTRAFSSSSRRRVHYVSNLSRMAMELAEQEFPEANQSVSDLLTAYESIIDNVPRDAASEFNSRLKELLADVAACMPEEVASEMFKEVFEEGKEGDER